MKLLSRTSTLFYCVRFTLGSFFVFSFLYARFPPYIAIQGTLSTQVFSLVVPTASQTEQFNYSDTHVTTMHSGVFLTVTSPQLSELLENICLRR
ncbi:hypothetical protein BJY52DRAFT_1243723 [Lactarius psammicola]|nr:hypothetical protein BJY52DRAFT_1243723 [Lactarius psammicola]